MKIYDHFIKRLLILIALGFVIYPSSAQNVTLYGMTSSGGIWGSGTIFIIEPEIIYETPLWNFGPLPFVGTAPYGNLVYNNRNGLFYGMTRFGGSHQLGTIFTFDPIANNDSTIWNFGNGWDGSEPLGDLVYDSINGMFYGLTYGGGRDSLGTLVSFDPSTGKDSVLYNFGEDPNLSSPYGNLVYDPGNGLYYAGTSDGGNDSFPLGGIISFNPSTGITNVVWRFGTLPDGERCYGSFVYYPLNGLLYGLTAGGGIYYSGAIISFDPVIDRDSVVWSFEGGPNDGYYPLGSNLVYNPQNGLLYGMTFYGGAYGYGCIFRFDPSIGRDSLLWSFGYGADGANPTGSLVYDNQNNMFYGMTEFGGANTNSLGTIISFDPSNNTESVIWSFGGSSNGDGAIPDGSLALYPPSLPNTISTINNTPAIRIYPNPTNGTVNITGLNKGQMIEVYDYLGQQISIHTADTTTKQIDLNERENGIYLIKISNKDGSIVSQKKIVKG